MSNISDNINIVDSAIQMLSRYTKDTCIKPIISLLEELKKDPDNEELLTQLTDTWRNLGIYQGTVLTYAPKFYTLIPDDIFGDD